MTNPTATQPDWISRWQRIARRIRVPLGFLTAALYLFELLRHTTHPAAVAWSPGAGPAAGLWLRAYASGYVKKNRELTVTGPYAYTRNPLYLGSLLIAAGFAVALLSWPVALVLALGFAVIYVPVIASEERFVARHFPRLRQLLPAGSAPDSAHHPQPAAPAAKAAPVLGSGSSSLSLYIQHAEYTMPG